MISTSPATRTRADMNHVMDTPPTVNNDGAAYFCTSTPAPTTRLTDKQFDPVTFDVLLVEPEDLASQITIVDLPLFTAIQPEELSSIGWCKRDKMLTSPNVVAFSRRFNHLCLWCQREILSRVKVKVRAEVLSLFTRVAKKLLDLNDIHSAFAIYAGLQSTAVHRLKLTWTMIPSRDRHAFDKMAKLFSEDKNWERLRRHVASLKLPCIPYLGLYLTDLVYIDVAHPTRGALTVGQREIQMNNILRVLADFQTSNYSHLKRIECVQNYLQSIRYIDELQKFVEDELYRKSCELEPDVHRGEAVFNRRDSLPIIDQSVPGNSTFPVSTKTMRQNVSMVDGSTTVTSAVKARSLQSQRTVVAAPSSPVVTGGKTTTNRQLFGGATRHQSMRLVGHRKTQSLGNAYALHMAALENSNSAAGTITTSSGYSSAAGLRHHLLDDSLLDATADTSDAGGVCQLMFNTKTVNWRAGGDKYGIDNPVLAGQQRWSLIDRRASTLPAGVAASGSCDDISGILGDLSLSPTNTTDMSNVSAVMGGADGADISLIKVQCTMHGAVRRRTTLKHGRKPTLGTWSRYYIALYDTTLCYFSPRSLPTRNTDARAAYKSKPSKMMSICGWMVVLLNDPLMPDAFQLQDTVKGHVYKFRAGTQALAMQWTQHLKQASLRNQRRLPENLIAFD